MNATIEQKRELARALLEQRATRTYPLSHAQERIWQLQQLDDTGAVFNMPMGLCIDGALDVAALSRSVAELVRRHDALRTTFVRRDGEVAQVVRPTAPIALEVVTAAAGDDDRTLIAHHGGAIAGVRFDLEAGPLFVARVVVTGRARAFLFWNMHHIVSDGWSMGLLARELATIYAAESAGRRAALAPLSIRYGDVATWQRSPARAAELAGHLEHWGRVLAEAPRALRLRTDRPRPSRPTFRGAREATVLPAPVADAVRRLAQARGATPFMALLAAFRAFLYRITGDAAAVIGTPVANRNRPELESIVGFFVNSLPLAGTIDGAAGFAAAVDAEREATLAAFAHEDVPLEQIAAHLRATHGHDGAPLFRVMFALQNMPPGAPFPGLAVREVEMPYHGSHLDLTLTMAEAPDGLLAVWEYNTDLFDRDSIVALAQGFRALIAAAIEDPAAPIAELPLLSPAAIAERIELGRAQPVAAGPDTLHALVGAAAGDHLAVVDDDGGCTYRELWHDAGELARRLVAAGLRAEEPVAIALGRGRAWVTALLAVARAGGVAVPLDPELPARRLEELVAAAGARIVLDGAHALPAAAPALPEVAPDQLAYVCFTSGSTGQPKPVAIPHHAIARRIRWDQAEHPLTADDRVLFVAAVGFDAAIWETLRALAAGATLIVAPPGEPLDPARLVARIARERVTVLAAVPSLLRALVTDGDLARATSLRTIVSAGEALSGELARRLRAATGARVFNFYGQTEVTIDAVAGEATGADDDWVPLGRPIAGMEMHVLDERLSPVPDGAVGEVFIGGPSLARGYLGRPDLTAQRFLPHPFPRFPGERIYRTGDLARRRHDGRLDFVGRVDDQVKIRGVRVEPREVDAVLARHPAVRRAATVAITAAPASSLDALLADGAPTQALAVRILDELEARPEDVR